MPMPMPTASMLLAAVIAVAAVSSAAGDAVRFELQPTASARREATADTSVVDDARLVAELKASQATAALGPVPDFNRRFTVRRTQTPPVIDGKLNDDAWAGAHVLTDFVVSRDFNNRSLGRLAADRTQALVLFDDEGLYVAVKAFQDPSTIYTTLGPDGLLRPNLDWEHGSEPWAKTGTDEIEISIDPELTRASYYTFHVNPDGITQKTYMVPGRVHDGLHKRIDPVVVADEAWRAAVSRDGGGWYAEVFIPWGSIGFRKPEPVEGNRVYFDMVTGRTVMGFNINRVSYERPEPSSWSPSQGSMFFRDPEHFGQAYFRDLAAEITKVDLSVGGEGAGTLHLVARSRRDEELSLAANVRVTGLAHNSSYRQEFSLPAGESASTLLPLEAVVPGRYTIEVELTLADGYILDRRVLVLEAPRPIEITALRSILYEGEADFPLRVTLGGKPHEAHEVSLKIISESLPLVEVIIPAADITDAVLPFRLDGLSVGAYRIEARLLREGVVVGGGEDTAGFRVIKSPWATAVSGSAGTGAPLGEADAPKGFAALADGDAGEAAVLPYEGEIGYLDGRLSEVSFFTYAAVATEDFLEGGGRRRGGGRARAPRLAQLEATLAAFAAGGEYEAVTFGVFALKEIENLEVTVTAPAIPGGATIPESHIDLRAERADRYLVAPEVLGGLAANTARRFFLTVYIPEGTPAGMYEGTVTVQANGQSETRTYQLLVLPFALEESSLWSSAYGRVRGNEADFTIADDLLAHGFDNLTHISVLAPGQSRGARVIHTIWGIDKPTGEGWLGDDPQKFEGLLNDNVFKSLRDTGVRPPFVVDLNRFIRYAPCTVQNARLLAEFVRRIEAKREEYGLGEFVYHIVDEPNNHYTWDDGRYGRRYGIQRCSFFGQVLKDMGLRQYITVNSTQRGYDNAEKAAEFCDIWVPNYISDKAFLDKWLARGKEVWLYNYAGDGASKGAMRSTYGFYALSIGATGVTIWNHRSFVRFLRGEGKLLDSSPWEAAREGVDDARYVETLARAIERAGATPEGRAPAEEAQRELDAILSAYPVPTDEKVAFERRHDADQWNKWRWIIARWIMRLEGAQQGL